MSLLPPGPDQTYRQGLMVMAGFVVAGIVAMGVSGLFVAVKVVERPQRAVLALAALVPFDGLLILVPEIGLLRGWKEALVAGALAATFIAPASARPLNVAHKPSWVPPAAALLVLGIVSILWSPLSFAIVGLKIDFYYLLVPLTLWRAPFNRAERDWLITILMIGGTITATVGIAQQWIGAQTLNQIGYPYNSVIRTTGTSFLRSFSTFEQPFPFAFYVAMVLSIGVPVALAEPLRRRNKLFLAVTPILLVGMATAVVRAAVFAVVVAAAYLIIRRYWAIVLVIPPALIVILLAPAGILESASSPDSLGQRVDGWVQVTASVIGEPLGTGVGTTGAAAELVVGGGAEPAATHNLAADVLPYQPDNYYMKRWLELGPLGLWLTYALLRHAVGSALRRRHATELRDRALADGIVAHFGGAIVAAWVATYWEIFPLDFYFWLFLGVLTSIEHDDCSTAAWPSGPEAVASRPTYAAS